MKNLFAESNYLLTNISQPTSCSPAPQYCGATIYGNLSHKLSFRLSKRTETKKFFPRGKLGSRAVVLRGGVDGGCWEQNPTYPRSTAGKNSLPQGRNFCNNKMSPFKKGSCSSAAPRSSAG
ncbi:MAG: hypothetical protein BWY04_00873 [candidate division CPR1 bacterium ADurb.Bin160]|uniref:Uncharacterized protein n=1 Tax=candidate division CPR1 bacterium ADurb.Bin160 TaxID=1852826 RepID=A0A1V5ZMD8_9BACT|nr:MAG: hypothetical protein BWY04_00873 [candidate division CPR1 bacterium ADurb.Bin160]